MTLPISLSCRPWKPRACSRSRATLNGSTNRNTIQRANHSIAISELLVPCARREIVISVEIFSFGDLLQRIHRLKSGMILA
ncbi:MAG: hypothetical protein K0Q83_2847 [Deltaproteobacteria bacterium]|nr:hypothetical protein [Deltaproteobacteria bacterium]